MNVNNQIFLRRRAKIVLPAAGAELLPINYVASMVKNIEALGCAFSEPLIAACRALTISELVSVYETLISDLKALRGAHRDFKPMYPNFPSQMMEMSEGELYLNAIVHYWSRGTLLPATDVKERFPLIDEIDLTMIDLGSPGDFQTLFGQIAGSNTSLSAQDKEDLTWFARSYGDGIRALLPASIPQKESQAFVAGLLILHASRDFATEFIASFTKTATDLLRLAVVLSEGDVSLATAGKFRTFSRPERTLMLTLLERLPNSVEDMLRWKGRWIRLGEKLHPGEYKIRFPKTAAAFAVLRNDEAYTTFNGQVEKALAEKDVMAALASLATRPGDLARRLDHLLRLGAATASRFAVVEAFSYVAPNVSTPVLLQVRQHFATRADDSDLRVFFPKGNLGSAQGVPNNLPALSDDICARIVAICEETLRTKFAALAPLGSVYVDPALIDYMAPFAMRSASKSLRTLVRGSRLPLPECEILRFFIWWKNKGDDPVDIDLSATLLDDKFDYVNVLSYYNLKDFGGIHSGDIVNAPDGASEFIDVSLAKLAAANVRYIAMSVHSYSGEPFDTLPECFAGWMARQTPQAGLDGELSESIDSGEIFEPRTVKDRLDLTAATKIAIPLVIDLVARKVIWCDIALRSHPKWQNNVAGNLNRINLAVRSLTDLKKPNLYDLFRLHAEARGTLADTPDTASTVFSVATGTPYRLEEIAAQYMG